MKKLFLAVAAVAMVFATSCKKENVNEPEVPAGDNEFICVIDQNANPQNAPMVEDGMGTMAHIDAKNNVWWQQGDQIAYYGQQVDETGQNVGNVGYHTLTCSATSDNKAYFSDPNKHFGQGAHEAFYPASLIQSYQKILPAIINLESGKNAGYLPMYAKGSGQHYLTFTNICAVLKIKIPASITTCNQIVVKADQGISGSFYVSTSTPYKAVYNGAGYSPDNTVTINAPGTTYFTPYTDQNPAYVYVAIPEKTTDGGYSNFTVTLNKVNGSSVTNLLSNKKTDNPMPVEAGKIYPITLNYTEEPTVTDADLADVFYFEARTGGASIKFNQNAYVSAPSLKFYIKNSTHSGSRTQQQLWKTYPNDTTIILAEGEKLYLKATGTNGSFSVQSYNHSFSITGDGGANIGGKLAYLLHRSGNEDSVAIGDYTFKKLFASQIKLYDISNLKFLTNLAESSFDGLFNGCSNLIATSITLPATTLAKKCYNDMFYGCTSLNPSSGTITISATTIGSDNCCYRMFYGCTALSCPVYINATTISGTKSMYRIFYNCYKLSNVYLPNCTSIAYASGTSASLNQWLLYAGTDSSVSSRTVHGPQSKSASDLYLTNAYYLSTTHAGTTGKTWSYSNDQ